MFFRLVLAMGLYMELCDILAVSECDVNRWTQNPNFGPNCEYMCHCKNNERCNETTGECPGQCQPGYMGTACQYLNVAFSETDGNKVNVAFSETDGNKSLINDGDIETCSSFSETDVHVSIEDVPVVGAAVYLKENIADANLREMSLTNVWQTVDGKCPLTAVAFVNGQTILKLTCDEPLRGQHAVFNFLQEQVPMYICEIQINAGRNLAYRQDAFASSSGWGGRYEFGVDGGHNNGLHRDEGDGTCIHSGSSDTNPWWSVTLAAPSTILWIRIYNRANIHAPEQAERLSGFEIHAISDPSVNEFLFYKDTKERSAMHAFPLNIVNVTASGYPLSYIRIGLRAGENSPGGKILNLCEFEVYGDCPDGKCGLECNIDCHCNSTSTADKITGACEKLICDAGQFWNGSVCESSTKSTNSATTMVTASRQTGTSQPVSDLSSTSSGITTTRLPGSGPRDPATTSSGITTTRLPESGPRGSNADRNKTNGCKMFIFLTGIILLKRFM